MNKNTFKAIAKSSGDAFHMPNRPVIETSGNDIFRSNRAHQEKLPLPFFITFLNSPHT